MIPLARITILAAVAFGAVLAVEHVRQGDGKRIVANDAVTGHQGSFVVSGALVFDGERVHPNAEVLVRNGVIHSVGERIDTGEEVLRIDGSGATLLPGLIDAHTHTGEVTQLERSARFGVTTVLDLFTRPEAEPTLRGASRERSDVAGFFSAGILATAPGGHGTESNPDIPTVWGPEQARAFVEEQAANGADYLKVVLNGERAMRGMPTLDEATVRALVDAGKAHGLVVVAHIETPEDARIAVEAGVDGLAHVWRTPGVPDGLPRLIAEQDVFVIPTLSVAGGIDRAGRMDLVEDPSVRPFLEDEAAAAFTPSAEADPRMEGYLRRMGFERPMEILDYHVASVTALHEAGVVVLAGSDPPTEGVIHGPGLLQEIELLVRAGLSPTEALSAATVQTAEAFGLTNRGRIRPGLRADLLLVDGDATADVKALWRIRKIWRGGVEVDRGL